MSYRNNLNRFKQDEIEKKKNEEEKNSDRKPKAKIKGPLDS